MDYKELIERLRASNRDSLVSSEEAATAIETLLAEREAAVAEMHGQCTLCVNKRKCLFDDEIRRDCALNKRRNWEWCGPTLPDQERTEKIE